MRLVIDANVMLSALIKEGKSAEILLSFYFDTYTPEFIFDEIEEHKDEILDKTRRSEWEFNNLLGGMKYIINVVRKEDFEDKMELANQICQDADDIMYLALALKLNCPIWSNDKKLKEQNKVKIYSTEEIVEEFNLN